MIPDYQSLMRPVLELASEGAFKNSDAIDILSDRIGLSAEEREEVLPSGKQTRFGNRILWAKTYLKQAGLVRYPQRGYCEITDLGRTVLTRDGIKIDTAYLETFPEFQKFRERKRGDGDASDSTVEVVVTNSEFDTPDEELLAAHQKINSALIAELLDKVRDASPAFFENTIVTLLIAMGYGGTSEEAGRSLGRSGDGGVDGVIDQDPLGVDQIYLQAKRYAEDNSVGAGAIRDFFGALSIKKANKGIFVTTSTFSKSAIETAQALGSRIVLIDGPHLGKLMLRYNIGCRIEQILEIKKLDEEFFQT